MKNEAHLKKNIGFAVATSLVVGTVIGSGIFMKPGVVISATGNSTLALWAWVIGGIITLASGLTIAEVSVRIPKTGGLYAYIEEVYGKMWGFLCGWVQTLIYGPAIMGALSLYFGSLVAGIFDLAESSHIIIGIVTLLFLAFMNLLGTQYGGLIQTVSTIGKLIPIVLIATFGIFQGDIQILNMDSGDSRSFSMGAAVLATLWAYDGWMNVGYMAGEMKNPSKTLPTAIITGIGVVILSYITVNIAMLHVLPASRIVELGPNAASTAASILFGDIGGNILTIGILISIFGCLNGKILTFPRIPFAMAENGLLPASKTLAKIHPKYQTPVMATILQLVIAVILMLLGSADRLSDIAIFAVFSFYGLAFFAVFILRKKTAGEVGLYRVPFFPITPIIAIIGAFYILGSTIMNSPIDAFLSIGIAIIGLPVFVILTRGKEKNQISKAS